jgi:hypothetical protein
MGGSYGGYAALAGLTFTPDLYACGVDIVGPSNIKTLFASIPPYWAPAKKELTLRVGDVENDPASTGASRRCSMSTRSSDPLMVLQGANDPRVKIAESDQIVAAMREKDLPVTYIVFPDEGHGFARPENRLDANARIERFSGRAARRARRAGAGHRRQHRGGALVGLTEAAEQNADVDAVADAPGRPCGQPNRQDPAAGGQRLQLQVETDAQAALLAGLGCPKAQDSLFGQPMPAQAAESLLMPSRGVCHGLCLVHGNRATPAPGSPR